MYIVFFWEEENISIDSKETSESVGTLEQSKSRFTRDYGKLQTETKKERGIYRLIDNAYIISIIGACVSIIPYIGIPIDLAAIICGAIAMKRDQYNRSGGCGFLQLL